MATQLEYALMAGAAYVSTRADINKIPVPQGWLEMNLPRFRGHPVKVDNTEIGGPYVSPKTT